MPTNPASDVATQLDAAGIGLTLGTNLFVGKERDAGDGIPGQAVFCLASGGPAPTGYADGTDIAQRYSQVQCMVRSAPRAFQAGETLARAVRDAIHFTPPTGYQEAVALESEPLYLGELEEGNHRWSVNFELWHEE